MKHNEPTVARSTALMSIATLASRVTGLARTFVMAGVIGNTLITSAYNVANTMPNIIYELVLGGLLNAAFVPLYLIQMEKYGREGGNRYASNLLNIVVLIMGILFVLSSIFAPQLIFTQNFLNPIDSEINEVAVGLFRIFAIQLLFYGIGGVVTSLLNAERVFFMPSIVPALNNIVVIASFFAYSFLVTTDAELALIVLAVGTTLGVVVQMAVQIPALFKLGFKWEFRIDFKDPGFVETIKTGIPMIIYVFGMMVVYSFRNAAGTNTGDNGVATLNYAWAWFQLPHGVIAVSLSRALFTEMSKAAAEENMENFVRFMKSGIVGTLLVVIPLAGLMGVLAIPVMQMYEFGEFTHHDVLYVASVLRVWVIALPFYSLQLYLFNVYASLRKFKVFAIICLGFCAVQCVLYLVLTTPELFGIVGISIADIVYYAATVVVLLYVLKRYVGTIGLKITLVSAAKALVATAVGVGLVILALTYLPTFEGPLGGFLTTVLYGCAGLIVILCLYQVFRVPEMKQIVATAGRFLKRGKPDSKS